MKGFRLDGGADGNGQLPLRPGDVLGFLSANRSILGGLLELLPLPAWYQDGDGRLQGVNSGFAALFGCSPGAGASLTFADLLPAEQAGRFAAAAHDLAEYSEPVAFASDLTTADGDLRHVRVYTAELRGEQGLSDGLIGLLIDLTEQVRLTRRLESLARYDELTGLNNRREGVMQLSAMVEHSARSGRALAVLVLDVDHFKAVNDTYGHETGDRVLQGVAAALQASLREYDLSFRLGGEEFVVALPDTGLETAMQVATRMRASCARAVAVPGPELQVSVTVSIGVACGTGSAHGADELLRRADDALYQAKRRGRDQVVSAVDGERGWLRRAGERSTRLQRRASGCREPSPHSEA